MMFDSSTMSQKGNMRNPSDSIDSDTLFTTTCLESLPTMIDHQMQEPGDDATSFTAWAERVKLDRGGFGKSSHQNKFGAWSRRFTMQSYINEVQEQEEDFRWFTKHVENDKDVLSPKLWSPTRQLAESSVDLHQLQPTSRAMEIARYRNEMIQLVKDTPESAHELSLKDIVDMPTAGKLESAHEFFLRDIVDIPTAGTLQKAVSGRTRRKKSRSKSIDVGIFTVNLILPFSLRGKRLKRSVSSSAGDSKVSTKQVKVSDKSFLSFGADHLKLSPKSVKGSGKSSLSSGAGDSKLSPMPVKVSDKSSVSSGGAGDLKVSPKPVMVNGKSSSNAGACDSKVSPSFVKVSGKSTKLRELWNQNENKDSSSSGSPSSRITRSGNRKLTGCYSFLANKIKTPSM